MTDAAGADRRGAVRVLYGGEAHAPHQRAALLRQLRAAGVAVGAFASREVFFLQLDEPLGRDEEQRLRGLLRLDPARAEGVGAVPGELRLGELRLVVPRIGTISPWSSKATDILRQCGFAAVRRIERGVACYLDPGWPARPPAALFDRMTQSLLLDEARAADLFAPRHAPPLGTAAVTSRGLAALREADAQLGLALAADELEYLAECFAALGRDPTDVELMMFAQINSEHCRHKIFRADWLIDNTRSERSLFDMIRHTHASHPFGTLSAYHDNAAVIAGGDARWLQPAGARRSYAEQVGPRHIVMKVETHNHPTAIAPWPGASTGAGGEIRDEGATGRGARPKAGVCGFSVSNLEIPDFPRPWEIGYGRPDRIVSALQIMLDGPLGAAAFNNEFGRPNLGGYFRTMEAELGGRVWGYHKPIMIAGGVGSVAGPLVEKRRAQPGALVLQLGGPGLLIGLGGGAASSMQAGDNAEQLDFNSVQRDNPQMQRRCQEVIDRCAALGSDNPILSIHDVGAGGLSNAVPELVHDCGCGADLELRQVPLDDPGLSPMEIWCNEAQERYVLLVDADRLEEFLGYCEAERCPVAVLGETTASQRLVVRDALFGNCPIDLDMDTLFGNAPKMTRRFAPEPLTPRPLPLEGIDFDDALERVLTFPAVADKSFLITIGDRSVGGLVCRDQFVGPDQVAVSDVAVTARDFHGHQGEAMAMGERTPVALLDPAAAARLAVAEAITNLAAAALRDRREIKLSANWMAAAGEPGQDAALYQAVEALGMTLCPALEVSVPVGKDSLSMKTRWRDEGMDKSVTAPVSLIVTAVAPVADVRATWTPELRPDRESRLMLVDLGAGKNRLGGSALAQVYGVSGQTPADLDEPRRLTDLLDLLARARSQQLVLASHDRSDGGLLVAALEMAFAGRCGVALHLNGAPDGCLPELFSEEPGVLLQVREADIERLRSLTIGTRLEGHLQEVGSITADAALSLQAKGVTVWSRSLAQLR
ncbi:MAG: phosphoribosylformylglycinamidine synthase, partial [Pseudomonadota bacterium]|nr:phosphoribosylformylglycinamidine synthase [Pseudomonadota bacterium]